MSKNLNGIAETETFLDEQDIVKAKIEFPSVHLRTNMHTTKDSASRKCLWHWRQKIQNRLPIIQNDSPAGLGEAYFAFIPVFL